MPTTLLHRVFAPIKAVLPPAVANPLRSVATALLTPVRFSRQTGHFRSSFRMRAVDRRGRAIPWYTYPMIDLLQQRNFADRTVLEFGGGQSSVWWGGHARHVTTFEGDRRWYERIRSDMPPNVALHYVPAHAAEACVAAVQEQLAQTPNARFDVIVIDGLWRAELIPTALARLAPGGVILCDNAEGYGFQAAFARSGLLRVDFHGWAPGCVLRTCTSAFFGPDCFLFRADWPLRSTEQD